jgi:hypothetical protein
MSEVVPLTLSTTRPITLRALARAPPFFELLRFLAFFAGAFRAGAEAFFAGAFLEAFLEEAFFAEAFFPDFLAGAFFEAFFEAVLEEDFLLLFFDFLLPPDFLAAAFFADLAGRLADLADFFAAFFGADFFADFFEADFFADFFLAAMDSLLFKTVGWGAVRLKESFVLRGNSVAQNSM